MTDGLAGASRSEVTCQVPVASSFVTSQLALSLFSCCTKHESKPKN